MRIFDRLKFDDPALESRYWREYAIKSIKQLRLAGIIAIGIHLLFEIGASPHTNLQIDSVRLIRYGFIIPGIVAFLALTYWRRIFIGNHQKITALFAVVTLGGGEILYMSLLNHHIASFSQAVIILMVMAFYSALRLNFMTAVASSLLFSAAGISTILFKDAMTAKALLSYSLFLIAANAIGMFVAYEKERELRLEYRLRKDLNQEKQRSETLLLNILPAPIATRLKSGESTIADQFNEVTVLFADLVGFTALSNRISTQDLILLLNELFSGFDQIANQCGVEKIKTIGDCYMGVAGIPLPRKDHATAVANMALAMLKLLKDFNLQHNTDLNLRIGINSGPVIAGVIGKSKFIYDLWGDTVNTASRMESHSRPGEIQVTQSTWSKLEGQFNFVTRGEIEIKDKGKMKTYWLVEETAMHQIPVNDQTVNKAA